MTRLTIATYNVGDKFGGKPTAIAAAIAKTGADIVGIQEGTGRKGQGKPSDLAAAIVKALPDYTLVTPTTDWNENYWLHRNTVTVEQLPDAILRVAGFTGKHCSRAIFTHKASGAKIVGGNTHLEHQKGDNFQKAREEQADIAYESCKTAMTVNNADDLFFLGDLNSTVELKAFTANNFHSAENNAVKRVNADAATFQGKASMLVKGPPIDYISVHGSETVHRYEVVVDQTKASDHIPVVADITFNK